MVPRRVRVGRILDDPRPAHQDVCGASKRYALVMDQLLACPSCHSDLVVPIVYGFADAGMAIDEEAGRIALGGCDITDNDPRWACRSCDSRW